MINSSFFPFVDAPLLNNSSLSFGTLHPKYTDFLFDAIAEMCVLEIS